MIVQIEDSFLYFLLEMFSYFCVPPNPRLTKKGFVGLDGRFLEVAGLEKSLHSSTGYECFTLSVLTHAIMRKFLFRLFPQSVSSEPSAVALANDTDGTCTAGNIGVSTVANSDGTSGSGCTAVTCVANKLDVNGNVAVGGGEAGR
jgi:hypothetical protein